MIKKYIAPLWCWVFGHDVIYPHPNRDSVRCLRCKKSGEL